MLKIGVITVNIIASIPQHQAYAQLQSVRLFKGEKHARFLLIASQGSSLLKSLFLFWNAIMHSSHLFPTQMHAHTTSLRPTGILLKTGRNWQETTSVAGTVFTYALASKAKISMGLSTWNRSMDKFMLSFWEFRTSFRSHVPLKQCFLGFKKRNCYHLLQWAIGPDRSLLSSVTWKKLRGVSGHIFTHHLPLTP